MKNQKTYFVGKKKVFSINLLFVKITVSDYEKSITTPKYISRIGYAHSKNT